MHVYFPYYVWYMVYENVMWEINVSLGKPKLHAQHLLFCVAREQKQRNKDEFH